MRMPKTLNPLVNEDITVDNILKLIFEPLFTIDSETLKPIPNIASDYSIEEGGKTVSITIRDYIYWHDGKQLTAKDVIFSLDTIRATENSLYKSALNNVASYSNKGNKVIINYTEPYSFFMYNLCFPIIPSHYYKNNLELWTDYTTYATEMMTFYIIQVADGAFQAVGQKDNFEYSILYNDYNELISILENMKGIEK